MTERTLPISAAKKFAVENDCTQVIVLAFDATGATHVVTYGKSAEDCRQAAQGGNKLKREFLGWPEELCNAKPTRTDFNE